MPTRGTGERLAFDPKNNNILYFAARSGNGLWKSTDGGVLGPALTIPNFPHVEQHFLTELAFRPDLFKGHFLHRSGHLPCWTL